MKRILKKEKTLPARNIIGLPAFSRTLKKARIQMFGHWRTTL
jgi:hypothetical protein